MSPSEIAARWKYRIFFSALLRNHIVERGGLDDAAKWVAETGTGFALKIVHFSQTDPIRAMLTVTSPLELRNARIVGPYARHQLLRRIDLLKRGRSIGVELIPVTTPRTMELAQKNGTAEGMKLWDGMGECNKRAAEVIAGGGISVSAPQGTRELYLAPWEGPREWAFYRAMRDNGLKQVPVIFASFEVPGYEDFSQIRGYNLDKRPYLVRFSAFYPNELEAAGGRARDLDPWAESQIGAISPRSYVHPSRQMLERYRVLKLKGKIH